jgi:hypothetical protein
MTPRFLLLAAVFTLFHSSALALESVGVAVQVRTEGAASGGKGVADTQKRSLAITLTNRTREELGGLTVKWVIFASDLKSGEIGKAGSGELKSSLPASGSETVQSQTTIMKYTPRHAETVTHKNRFNDGNNRGKNRQQSVKIVDAKGDRYRGWGVQVLRGGTVVGEAYSTPELKAQM